MINILSESIVNQIAAGEVVERPASVVKELIENSIDAGATEIRVYIQEFGTGKIQVIDNGSGIEKNDLERVFLKHATSKITNSEDLNSIHSFGFRGEALASISSVSRVILQTKHKTDDIGSEVIYENGKIAEIRPSAISSGTDIQILDLFSNVPARKKFLKSQNTENKAILDIFNKFVLANPQISFFIDIDGTKKNYTVEPLKARISKLLKVKEEDLVDINFDGVVKVSGFVIHPRIFLKTKANQFIFVNKRPVSDGTVYKAIIDGFDTFLMKNQFAGFVIFVDLPANMVDVNVHPRKTEVRFASPSEIYKSVRTAVNVNLIRVLKQETHKKLNIQEENTASSSSNFQNIENVRVIDSKEMSGLVQEPFSNYEKSSTEEFEAFLTRNSQKESLESRSFEDFNQKPLIKKTTEQALLFNKELVNDDAASNSNIYLDFANAIQLLDSYIITANGKDILIIDQHAASERYFYEKYLNQLKSKKVRSKLLLFPEIVTLESMEIKELEEHKDLFDEMGFDFEIFGDEEIKFSKVPDFIKMDNFQKIIERIIEDILENKEVSNVKDKIYHEIAAILACHTAVRFGDKLTREEIIHILKNLASCKDPYNCPHGRPVIQELGKYEVEKKFKRCGL